MCLDESSRSLRASDTSSNCFSISLESERPTRTGNVRLTDTCLFSLSGHNSASHCILTCYLLLESINLAPKAPNLHLFVGSKRSLARLMLQSLHRLGGLCRGTGKVSGISSTLLQPERTSSAVYSHSLDNSLTLELATELHLLLLQPADSPLVGFCGQAVLKAALDI